MVEIERSGEEEDDGQEATRTSPSRGGTWSGSGRPHKFVHALSWHYVSRHVDTGTMDNRTVTTSCYKQTEERTDRTDLMPTVFQCSKAPKLGNHSTKGESLYTTGS